MGREKTYNDEHSLVEKFIINNYRLIVADGEKTFVVLSVRYDTSKRFYRPNDRGRSEGLQRHIIFALMKVIQLLT